MFLRVRLALHRHASLGWKTRALSSSSSAIPGDGKKVLSVALVGRPNTGKSTLFNRLTKSRKAIVSDVPGTTRDRREGKGYLAGLPLKVIDTGGLDDRGSVSKNIQDQVEHSVRDTDIILFMLDARAGITALDNSFAKWLRSKAGQYDQMMEGKKNSRKVFVVANKSEGAHLSDVVLDSVADASRLGFGLPMPVSASHGDGLADLAVQLVKEAESRNCYLDDKEEREARDEARMELHKDVVDANGVSVTEGGVLPELGIEDKTIQLAFMGRPNVGKSTLMNAIIGDDRVITGPIAGLTRDAIEVEWEYARRSFRLVDTAGLTRTRTVPSLAESKLQKKLTKNFDALGMGSPTDSSGSGKEGSEASTKASTLIGMPSSTTAAKPSVFKKIVLPGIQDVQPGVDPSQFSYQVSELALINALNALRFAQVVVLVVDAEQRKFSKTDLQLATRCLQEGRGMVVVANKSDLLTTYDEDHISGAEFERAVKEHCDEYLRDFGDIPVVVTSALNGKNVKRVLRTVIDVHDAWSKRCPTWVLNRWLRDTMVTAPPARYAGKPLKIKYITQTKSRPPMFTLFTNVNELPGAVERFLKTRIQEDFQLKGVPLRFVVRKTAGNEVRKDLLKNKVGSHGKNRRGKGHGEGRGVGPNKRNIPIEVRKLNDKRDIRRRRDTRQKKIVKTSKY